MGLRIHALELIEAIKPYLPVDPVCYMIGTQDCGFSYRALVKRYPAMNKEICEKIEDLDKRCDLKTLFKVLGFSSVIAVDINDRADARIDLSKPIPEEYHGRADLVCEFGTLEHIFNLKTSIENINCLLKKGGIVFHMSPVSCYQHGFFNFNPRFFDLLYSTSEYRQIFRTMNISIYNPLFVIDRNQLPRWLKGVFAVTNKMAMRGLLYRYNLPLSREGNNRVLSFFNFWTTSFGMPKNLLYCCAYQKQLDALKIPYDIWE